jgi:hypothetical protein
LALGEATLAPRVTESKNDPIDLQILQEFVCSQYTEIRKAGGRASSPYRPFFFETLGKFQVAKEAGADVTLTIAVQRPDGTYGSIDLIELFKELGFM